VSFHELLDIYVIVLPLSTATACGQYLRCLSLAGIGRRSWLVSFAPSARRICSQHAIATGRVTETHQLAMPIFETLRPKPSGLLTFVWAFSSFSFSPLLPSGVRAERATRSGRGQACPPRVKRNLQIWQKADAEKLASADGRSGQGNRVAFQSRTRSAGHRRIEIQKPAVSSESEPPLPLPPRRTRTLLNHPRLCFLLAARRRHVCASTFPTRSGTPAPAIPAPARLRRSRRRPPPVRPDRPGAAPAQPTVNPLPARRR